jgi:hypothetical protein
MKFDRNKLEELTLQKIKEVNDEAGYRSYLEVPEMVNIVASIMEDKFRVEYDDLVNQILLKKFRLTFPCLVSYTSLQITESFANMKTQEQLFNDIKNLALKVDKLKGWVQNDFDRMIADGTVTKEYLMDSLKNIHRDFDKATNELLIARLEVMELVEKKAHNL